MVNAPASSALAPAFSGAGNVSGLAVFGKTAFALLVIVAIVFVLAWLARRVGPLRGTSSQRLKLIAVKALGTKERVAIVEVAGTWLVLGVASGGVSKLHELPAQPAESVPANPIAPGAGSFGQRFAAALKQNFGGLKR